MEGLNPNTSKKEDVSHKTLIVLVVLTVLISLLSTWTVLTEVNNAKLGKTTDSSSFGKVKLKILAPGEIDAHDSPEPVALTGRVAFNIE